MAVGDRAPHIDFRLPRRTVAFLDDTHSATTLAQAIATLRGESARHGSAIQSERGASPEAGAGGADGALLRFTESHGLVSSEEWLAVLSPLEGGNEHEIFRDPETSKLAFYPCRIRLANAPATPSIQIGKTPPAMIHLRMSISGRHLGSMQKPCAGAEA